MCGRYTVLTEDEIVAVREILRKISLHLVRDEPGADAHHSPEVFPSDCAPILMQEPEGTVFARANWGFQRWDGVGVIINARCESLRTKPAFAPLLLRGRCVVPAGAFFEWEKLTRGKRKHYVRDAQGNLLFMAGLYRDVLRDGERVREFVIITKQAQGAISDIHDRMPALLRTDELEPWLTGRLTIDELARTAQTLTVQPCEPRQAPEQLSLF